MALLLFTVTWTGVASSSHTWELHETAAAAAIQGRAASQVVAEMHGRDRSQNAPVLPTVWNALVNFTEEIDGKPVQLAIAGQSQLQVVAQDDLKGRGITRTHSKMPFAPAAFIGTPLEWINITQFQTSELFGIEVNGEKLDGTAAYGAHYNSIFSWVKYAKPGPLVTINGTMCASWVLQIKTGVLKLLLDAHGTPRLFEENVTVRSGSSTFNYHLRYEFSTFTPNGTLPGVWDDFNATAFTAPKQCSSTRPQPNAVKKMVYVFHPQNDFNVSSQDVGSILGDTLFLCAEGKVGGGHSYEWVTNWEIDHIPNYGQYQNCNGYPPKCLGSENFWVGHEAAMGLGPASGDAGDGLAAGQCVDNPLVGEWYSLPAGGKCKAGQEPGDGTCSWRARRVKTIDSKCLFQPSYGFFDACVAQYRAPQTGAAKILRMAFDSDVAADGGCPALPGPEAA